MSSTSKILWQLGHYHNPAHWTDVDPFDEREVDGITETDSRFESAVVSYMEYFLGDLNQLCQKHHGRFASLDGHPGPAFAELLEQPRCGHPDFVAANKQEANWPDACRRKLRFGRDFDSAPGLNKEDTDKAFWGAVNNWTQALADLEMVSLEVGDTAAEIFAKIKRLSGSTLAWSYLAQNRCNVTLDQRYNTSVDWGLVYLCTVATHEIGHAIGLPHNRDRDALMYPSIHQRSIGRAGYPNDTDLGQCRSVGYRLSGKPQLPESELFFPRTNDDDDGGDDDNGGDDDDDTGKIDPSKLWLKSTIQWMIGDKPYGPEKGIYNKPTV